MILLKEINKVAIYHCVYAEEDFATTAKILFQLVQGAQHIQPNLRRMLYLDIEGHRNENGGFDRDMFELQNDFILGFLMPYLHEVYMPLLAVRNPRKQVNDLPNEFYIFQDVIQMKNIPAEVDEMILYRSDLKRWFRMEKFEK